jgi:hypothetical protein
MRNGSLFDSCPKLDPLPYSTMVAGYVKSGNWNAHQLFEIMAIKVVSPMSLLR